MSQLAKAQGPRPVKLLTIPVSHFCEKARWALEYCDVPFTEHRTIQVLHYVPTWWYARTLFVPVLLTSVGPLRGSEHICRYADANAALDRRLYPADPSQRQEAEQWESQFGQTLGVETRRWAYWVVLRDLGLSPTLDFICQGTAPWQRPIGALVMPLARRYLARRLTVTEVEVKRGLHLLRETFGKVGERLSDGRRFLVGDRFSIADLTFASLSALVLFPRRYGVEMPQLRDLSPESRRTVDEFRDTPAGKYALALYESKR